MGFVRPLSVLAIPSSYIGANDHMIASKSSAQTRHCLNIRGGREGAAKVPGDGAIEGGDREKQTDIR